MRASGVLCTLLLMVGGSCAFPQYGQPQEQLQQEPQQPLTEGEQAALGEFWWKNQGVFNPEGNGGTIVVVQDPVSETGGQVPGDLASPFIPSPSPECGELHGCIPWQYCVDGKFTNTGEGLLALRTPSKVPETYSQKLCGQIGNLCCRIPDALLIEQHQGPVGNIAPYESDSVDGIIEVVSTGLDDGTVAIVDQTSEDGATGVIVEQISGGGGGGYGGGDGATGAILEQISGGGAGATGTIVELVSGGAEGATGTIVEQISGGGGYGGGGSTGTIVGQGHIGGEGTTETIVEEINEGSVGGTGVIVEEVSGGSGGGYGGSSTGIIVIPEVSASGCLAYTHDCVPYFQCIDGEINTSGAGLIDVRIRPQKECTNPEYPEVPGICCRIPGATTPIPPLQTCPGGTVCLAKGQCSPLTDSTGVITTGGYDICYFNFVDASNYQTGECCQPPPPPPPAHLVTCPGNQVCVTQGQCLTQGTGADDVTTINSCYYSADQAVIGECCDPLPPPPPPPTTPAPLITCPGTQDCVESYQCNADGTINTDGASLINLRVYQKICYLDVATSTTGVCCQPPVPTPPPTPAPLVTCPGPQVCISQGDCAVQSVATGGTGDSYSPTCYIDAANYVTGVCCVPPPPTTPAPVVTCPGDQVCLTEGECTSQSAATGGTGASYTTCVLDPATYATGVCCASPIRVVNVCPDDSVCVPDILCQGEILDDADQYIPYGNSGTWSYCPLGDGLETGGVCCRNPEPVSTPKPYVAANQCGVRNYGLDLRTPVKLAKNEAQFGEFPWQAIIFFSNFTFKCGASLIEDRWLLTAAHCVDGYKYDDFRIRLGEWQVDKYDEPLKYVDVEIASITVHPDFKPGPVHNDIAVIELTAPVKFQYHVNALCLPSYGFKPSAGTRCFATGWGKDAFDGNYQTILKKVDVPVVEHSNCQTLLRKTRLGKYFILDKSFMCAGGEENIDACEGDGGGPLVCEDPESNTYYLAGITAWGIDCGKLDVPGVYVDVQGFINWVQGIMLPPVQIEQQVSGYGR